MANQLRTTLLLAGLTVFLVVVGRMLGGTGGMVVALVLAAGMNFFSYWFSDKMVLSMYRAREVHPNQAPELYDMVRTLSQRANLPMPKVYIIPNASPNAFATGRNPQHAVVAVTEGLLEIMDKQEVMGVLAHEMAHVKNRDILVGTIAATMAGAIMVLASMARWAAIFGGGAGDDEDGGLGFVGLIVMSIVAPLAAMIIQMAVSRSREYLADATGAQFMGSPQGLAGALEKLGAYSGRRPMNANAATAHMFIVNPLSGKSFRNLFSTHPPLEDRIARLRGQSRSAGPGPRQDDQDRRQADDFWSKLS